MFRSGRNTKPVEPNHYGSTRHETVVCRPASDELPPDETAMMDLTTNMPLPDPPAAPTRIEGASVSLNFCLVFRDHMSSGRPGMEVYGLSIQEDELEQLRLEVQSSYERLTRESDGREYRFRTQIQAFSSELRFRLNVINVNARFPELLFLPVITAPSPDSSIAETGDLAKSIFELLEDDLTPERLGALSRAERANFECLLEEFRSLCGSEPRQMAILILLLFLYESARVFRDADPHHFGSLKLAARGFETIFADLVDDLPDDDSERLKVWIRSFLMNQSAPLGRSLKHETDQRDSRRGIPKRPSRSPESSGGVDLSSLDEL